MIRGAAFFPADGVVDAGGVPEEADGEVPDSPPPPQPVKHNAGANRAKPRCRRILRRIATDGCSQNVVDDSDIIGADDEPYLKNS